MYQILKMGYDLITCGSYVRNLFLAGIPTEVIQQNLGHADVKTTQVYIGVLDGSTRAPVSVYDASIVLERLNQQK